MRLKLISSIRYALDKYDLTSSEQNKISHPHSVALPIALALAFLIMGIVYVLKKFGHRNSEPHN